MTVEEKQLIERCRVVVIGTGEFVKYVESELKRLGFNGEKISLNESESPFNYNSHEIIIECVEHSFSVSSGSSSSTVIYAFDFVDGAGALVLLPDDDHSFVEKSAIRLRMAEYMVGYCAFWNVGGYEWLLESIEAIRTGKKSRVAQKTAAYMCARIAANIATHKNVKHFPRFYLSMAL